MNPDSLPIRDIHLPEQIGWWPPAVGWWMLVLIILLSIVFAIWLYRKLTRKTAVKTARKLLLNIKQDQVMDNDLKLAEISILLRRTAVSIFSRQEIASLTGMAWLEFLDSCSSGTDFTQGEGRVLLDAQYRKNKDVNIDALLSLCEDWLTKVARKAK